ncbi:hypothetical protein FS749_009974 [Ceratobasidium sp. UAMH 11750]|nr:hypothetical protein FS749_009974 [Ceratobasidium sp. UAMH 11750]
MSRDTVSIFAVLDDLETFENDEYESRSQSYAFRKRGWLLRVWDTQASTRSFWDRLA